MRSIGSSSQADMSRRSLLKAGGALVVSFSLAGVRETVAQPQPIVTFEGVKAAGTELDSWVAVTQDNRVHVFLGRTEFGQGTVTALLQIAAEELDVDMDQVLAVAPATGVTRDQGRQVSSSSIHYAAPELRAACAEARQALLQLAAARLGVDASEIRVAGGVARVAGQQNAAVTYGDLLAAPARADAASVLAGTPTGHPKRFDLKVSGKAPLKPASSYTIVGTRVARLDTPAKMDGSYEYIQHVRLPNMLHGRVVRPRGQGPVGAGAKVVSIDESSIAGIPGVQLIRKGDFIGVVAPNEWHAVKAAAQLKVAWETTPSLPGHQGVHKAMRASKTTDRTLLDEGHLESALSGAAHVVSASFEGPYESHAPFAPNCALADVRPDGAVVICATQQIYPTRDLLAKMLKLDPATVQVRYVESSGCFGHACYDDAAVSAAIMSQAINRPVRLQFMRHDEMGWDGYGPAHLAEVRAGVDDTGKIVGYEYQGWQHGWYVLESGMELAYNMKVPEPVLSQAAIVNRFNAGAMYEVPHKRLVNHGVSGLGGYLKGTYLRSPVDASLSFASEQVIDELARKARIDAVEFRRRNISDPRWRGVLDAVADAAKWQPRVSGSRRSDGEILRGRGVALGTHFSSYGAAVAEVEVNRRTGAIRVIHLYSALDAGLIVNPTFVEQQIEGMMIQAASRALHEEVKFDQAHVTSLDWSTYPILRFADAPSVTAIPISRPDQPSTGAGEEALAAGIAAIANAFCDATGVRLYQRPMTPDRVLAALKTA